MLFHLFDSFCLPSCQCAAAASDYPPFSSSSCDYYYIIFVWNVVRQMHFWQTFKCRRVSISEVKTPAFTIGLKNSALLFCVYLQLSLLSLLYKMPNSPNIWCVLNIHSRSTAQSKYLAWPMLSQTQTILVKSVGPKLSESTKQQQNL